ncbi:MAG: hypothetical protein AB1545_01110 [Thermodesulfobacteriota bacterium]
MNIRLSIFAGNTRAGADFPASANHASLAIAGNPPAGQRQFAAAEYPGNRERLKIWLAENHQTFLLS